jgi:hypothetical protein
MGEDRKIGIGVLLVVLCLFLIGAAGLLISGVAALITFVSLVFACVIYVSIIAVIFDTDPIEWTFDRIEKRINPGKEE